MARQALQRRTQFGVGDAFGGGLDVFGRYRGQINGMRGCTAGRIRRLDSELNTGQVDELIESDELSVQSLLLIA